VTDHLVEFEMDGSVAIVRLNRPQAMNAMTGQLMIDLMKAAIRCDEDPSVRAVVLTGAGRAFCVGADVKDFVEAGETLPSLVKELTVYIHAAVSRFARMDAPLIAAVNGMAAGGGFSLSLCSDLTFASESATFVMAYTASGLSPDASSTFFLPRLVGVRRARQLALTNRRLSAHDAMEWGLVDEVVADDALMETALAAAHRLASGPTASYGSVKRLMLASFDNGLETQMELEAREIADNVSGHDAREGILAFVEKRPPVFTGNR
jgi:2-(1,2-epoxy-1,2-dihydrophenyl)acetyl-CoA isomerase